MPFAAFFLTLSVLFFSAGAIAQEGGNEGYFTLQLENDKFIGTDRHYTHGTRLAWVWEDENKVPDWISGLLDKAYILSTPKKKQMGFALGQSIFTPEDTLSRGLITNDRPYAGWTYLGLSLHADVDGRFFGRAFEAQDTMVVDMGWVGPQSYAKQAQNGVHRLLKIDEANGWDNQLKNEPVANLMLERTWRRPSPYRIKDVEWDILPSAGVSLGTVHTHASGGLMLRLGKGLNMDFGPPKTQPSLPGRAAFAFKNNDDIGWYVFVGAEGRYVARNLFLDGNTFADSHSVDKEPWVGDFRVGAVLTYGRVRVALTQVYRTREFKAQRQGDSFGALTTTIKF